MAGLCAGAGETAGTVVAAVAVVAAGTELMGLVGWSRQMCKSMTKEVYGSSHFGMI